MSQGNRVNALCDCELILFMYSSLLQNISIIMCFKCFSHQKFGWIQLSVCEKEVCDACGLVVYSETLIARIIANATYCALMTQQQTVCVESEGAVRVSL